MKKLLKSFASLTIIAVVATGCSVSGPDKSPEDTVKEGFANLYDLTSYSYEVAVDVDATVQGDSMKSKFTLTGSQEFADPMAPKLMMEFAGTGSLNDGGVQSAGAEMRLDATNLYFIINTVSDFDGLLPAEIVAPYVGKWFSMELPADTFTDVAFAGADESTLTEEEKATRDLLKETLFFTDLSYVGDEDGSYHYTGVLDKEAVVDFVVKGSEINGSPATEADIAEMQEGIKTYDMTAEIWVEKDSMTVNKMMGALTTNGEGEDIKVNFDVSLANFNKAVKVEVPEGAEVFDPYSLFGGF
jgi:hypothetical protein